MKVHYILAAIVFLACSCEEGVVTGIAVLGIDEAVPVAETVKATETDFARPILAIQPPLLIEPTPVDGSESAKQPEILPMATSIRTMNGDKTVEDNFSEST